MEVIFDRNEKNQYLAVAKQTYFAPAYDFLANSKDRLTKLGVGSTLREIEKLINYYNIIVIEEDNDEILLDKLLNLESEIQLLSVDVLSYLPEEYLIKHGLL